MIRVNNVIIRAEYDLIDSIKFATCISDIMLLILQFKSFKPFTVISVSLGQSKCPIDFKKTQANCFGVSNKKKLSGDLIN